MNDRSQETPPAGGLSTPQTLDIAPAPPAPVDVWLHPVLVLMIAVPNIYLGDAYGDRPGDLSLFGFAFVSLFVLLTFTKLGPQRDKTGVFVHPLMLLSVMGSVVVSLLLGRLLFLEGVHV